LTIKADRPAEAETFLEKAIVQLKTLIPKGPDLPEYHSEMGLCYRELVGIRRLEGKPADHLLKPLIAARREWVRLRPDDAEAIGELAWTLVMYVENPRNASEAVQLAQRAVQLAPLEGFNWRTLGIAQYKAGEFRPSVEALKKTLTLTADDAFAPFFLAMAQWQFSDRRAAREWYRQAVERMDKNPPDEALTRVRADAEALLGVPKLLKPNPKP
jgi:tetratricopeptide (TPR) repeat protein